MKMTRNCDQIPRTHLAPSYETLRSEIRSDLAWVVLDLTTTTLQKCEAVQRRARIQGSYTFASLNFRLENSNEEEVECTIRTSSIAQATGARS